MDQVQGGCQGPGTGSALFSGERLCGSLCRGHAEGGGDRQRGGENAGEGQQGGVAAARGFQRGPSEGDEGEGFKHSGRDRYSRFLQRIFVLPA